jgi:hypothetical protein
MDGRESWPERLKHRSGRIINGAVFFLAVVCLRLAVAVFETIRAGRGILSVSQRTPPLPAVQGEAGTRVEPDDLARFEGEGGLQALATAKPHH